MKELNELVELAKKATGGEWFVEDWNEIKSESRINDHKGVVCSVAEYGSMDEKFENNLAFIAAANPETILAIDEAFRELEQRAEAAEAKLAELEKQEPVAYTDAEEIETMLDEGYADMLAPRDAYKSDQQLIPLFTRPAPAVSLAEGLHPSTGSLVISFAEALAKKLRRSEEKYGWSDGWKDADWKNKCLADFHHHIGKGDPIDVAAYCAFMWHHGWATKQVPAVSLAELVPEQALNGNAQFLGDKEPYYNRGWNDCRAAILRSIEGAK